MSPPKSTGLFPNNGKLYDILHHGGQVQIQISYHFFLQFYYSPYNGKETGKDGRWICSLLYLLLSVKIKVRRTLITDSW